MLSDHSRVQLEVNNRRKVGKCTLPLKLDNSLEQPGSQKLNHMGN